VTASLHYTHGPSFAVAEVTALAFVEHVEPILEQLAEHTRLHGDRRLLINLMDVVGTFGHDEQKVIGLLAYRHLSHLNKVASLVPEEKITRVSENVAREQGMELRVFTVFSEAVKWLST
jgi:predicted component of type VI protein secretion system